MGASDGSALLFDPARLAQARRLRGLLKSELAKSVGLSQAAIGQFEADQTRPTAATLGRLAIALRMPVDFFQRGRPSVLIAEEETNFRSLRSTTKRERAQARATVELLAELVGFCEQYLALPSWDDTIEFSGSPEEVAVSTRDQWELGVGPIGNMVGLLERRGVVVARMSTGTRRVDAFSCWVGERPYVMLAADKDAADRSRFDAAHELGHLLLHPDPMPGLGSAEIEAHQFAAAFLMPAASIMAELPRTPDLARLVDLKLRWKVSVQALLRRGRDLGVYSDASYRRIYQVLGARGWRTKEPGDLGPPEQPTLLPRAAQLLGERYGDELIRDRIRLPDDDLTQLMSMLDRSRPAVLEL